MNTVSSIHKEEYGIKAAVTAEAPGRFHLIGEHTSFFKDKTLSMAVNMKVQVAVSLRNDQNCKFYFYQLEEKKRVNLSSLKYKKEDKWANALKAVLYGFTSGGFELKGMDFTIYSDMLPSAGFGITTAIKVASAWAVRELLGLKMDDHQLIQVIERANKLFLKTLNYRADIYSAVYSEENNLVLTDYANSSYQLIPFKLKDRTVFLTDAKVPRVKTWDEETFMQPENVLLLGELKDRYNNVYGGWKYEENPTEVNEVLSVVNEDTRRRLLCVMSEHKCILDAVSAIEKQNFGVFARSIKKSHENMRDLYDNSCPEIDWILKRVYDLDENPQDMRYPVNCGRITGKGFGRSLYAVIRNEDVDKYKEKLDEYQKIFGFKAETHIVKPAKGVCLL